MASLGEVITFETIITCVVVTYGLRLAYLKAHPVRRTAILKKYTPGTLVYNLRRVQYDSKFLLGWLLLILSFLVGTVRDYLHADFRHIPLVVLKFIFDLISLSLLLPGLIICSRLIRAQALSKVLPSQPKAKDNEWLV